MSGPSRKTKPAPPGHVFVPHPDDAESVLAGIEAAERGEALSDSDSEAFVRELMGETCGFGMWSRERL
jgi:hypothetical protein